MRLAPAMALCLLAVACACRTDDATDRAVAPTPSNVDEPTPTIAATRTTTATTPASPDTTAPSAPVVAAPVEGLVHYGVAGRHTGESFVVAVDGTYTLDISNDGLPPATGPLTAAELSRLKAAIAATVGVAPPQAPETLRSESPPVVGVTLVDANASALRNDDMPGPWGKLAAVLVALMTAHLPEHPFVATLAPDARHMTLRQRSTTPVPACFAVAVATVFGRGDRVVRAWESPPLEPDATADDRPHGPRVASCSPSPRAPGWTLDIPLAVGAPRRGESLYVSVYAVVSGEPTTLSVEPRER